MTKIIGGQPGEKEIFTPALQTKTTATAVGLPDDLDVKNIETILRNYEIAKPGEIKMYVKLAKDEQTNLKNDFGSNHGSFQSTGKETYRRSLTMPIGLYRQIEEAYPLMFTNKNHLHWFMKKFPMFNVARKV